MGSTSSNPVVSAPLTTIMDGTSAEVIHGLLTTLFPDSNSILDTTFGNGSFWTGSRFSVIGMDINRVRAKTLQADFTKLPFKDKTFDVVVFDPPFQTDMGRGKASVMGARFATYPTLDTLQYAVLLGVREAWRVSKLGIIVKVQDYIHASQRVWMSEWVQSSLPLVAPYDVVYLKQKRKMNDPKWKNQLSVRTNHSTFWVYRKDGPKHKHRKAAEV